MSPVLRLRPSITDSDDVTLDRGPLLAEAVVSALHATHESFSLEIGSRDGKTALFARASDHLLPLIRGQLYAQYPEAEIEKDPDLPEGTVTVRRELQLANVEVRPIKTYSQFIDAPTRRLVDPLAGVLSALEGGRMEIHLTPLHHVRRHALKAEPPHSGLCKRFHGYARFVCRLRLTKGWKRLFCYPFSLLLASRGDPEHHSPKVDQILFHARIRLRTSGDGAIEAEARMHQLAASFNQFTLPDSNGFRVIAGGRRTKPFLFSAEEVATLWHVPGPLVQASSFDRLASRQLELPLDLSTEGTMVGDAIYRGKRVRFAIAEDDRRRHLHLVGKTGSGKTTLLENMIVADVAAGRGVAVLDPHGDLIDATLRSVPKNRTNDVVLIDPSDHEFPVSLNVLACDPVQRQLTASGILSVFKKIWPDVWSGRMEYILRNCLLALMEADRQSLLGVPRLLVDPKYRQKILENVTDPVVLGFWQQEYEGWTERYRVEAIAAVQNKVGQLLTTPILRNLLGQAGLTIDLRHAMDTRKIVLVNLSKGKIGEDVSSFLGSLLITRFQLAAMSRADVPESQRVDFYLYADEFQNFATDSFATILSEARKYRLNLALAHQYLGQLTGPNGSTAIRDAVFGNVGSVLCFQGGPEEADLMSRQFENLVLPKDILNLPKYHAYMRLLMHGQPSKPFLLQTLPPPESMQDAGRVDLIRALSRDRYAEPRIEVETKIARWTGAGTQEGPIDRLSKEEKIEA